MSDWKVWRVIECYGSYTVALVKPEINGRDKVVEHSNKWFGYYPVSKAFDFYWKGEGAMLWIGDNGRLVSLGEGQEHKYMMLGRMLSDCKYFLRNPYERHLYFPSIARHCKEMRQYWLELNIKPEWLSYKQIGRIEHKMNRMKTKLDRQFKKRQIWRIEETSRERRRVQAQRSSWLAYR